MSKLHYAQFGAEGDAVRLAMNTGFTDIETYVGQCLLAAMHRRHHAAWRDVDDDGWLTFADAARDADVAALVSGNEHDEVFAVDSEEDREPVRVEVLERDEARERLRVRRRPGKRLLRVKTNCTPLRRQQDALQEIKAPLSSDRPLLRLCDPLLQARWPAVSLEEQEPQWQVLLDGQSDGAAEQRHFVRMALATPDFAVLEGPPGSGKTTAILELILQQVRRGKRLLLCASTHVAVDNVLERLARYVDDPTGDVFAVRFGHEHKVSEAARRFRFDNVVESEKRRIRSTLQKRKPLSAAQKRLLAALDDDGGALEAAILDLANVVCGTTIGILELQAARGAFDMLILDEASKTTFQEFLVPALRAKRWVVVGDRRQLSPYVDQSDVAANLLANVHKDGAALRAARVDVLAAGGRHAVAAVVATIDASVVSEYFALGLERHLDVANADDADDEALARADIVVGSPAALGTRRDQLPLDAATLRGVDDDVIRQRHRAWHHGPVSAPRWEDELAWRLADGFALRLSEDTQQQERRNEEAQFLTSPADRPGVARVQRVAFPSILELLESGLDSKFAARATDVVPPRFLQRREEWERLKAQGQSRNRRSGDSAPNRDPD